VPAAGDPAKFLSPEAVYAKVVEMEYQSSQEALKSANTQLANAIAADKTGSAGPCDLSVAQALATDANKRFIRAKNNFDRLTTRR
jgi:hypothetical protein